MTLIEAPEFPSISRLPEGLTPELALRRLSGLSHVMLFDSALRLRELGRYSFLAADPFAWCEVPADGSPPLDSLESELQRFRTTVHPALPPFQGGAAGLFGYELGRSFERIPAACHDEFQCPVMAVGLYDVVLAWDHVIGEAWIISQGFPELAIESRRERAVARLRQFEHWLEMGVVQSVRQRAANIPLGELAPQWPTTNDGRLTSNFSRDEYLASVRRVVEYIRAGDVFQVNLSQRLLHPAECPSVELYLRLRERNPAPFAGYFDGGDFQVCSASPERFVSVRKGLVVTRPIKGTRQRTRRPEADLFAGDELLASEKDRAENVMIVDLMRNDLSKVCNPDSVRVTQLCGLENYAFVQHLVSVVEGRLENGYGPLDLIRAAFPGGSITGAPKVRAMEIIAELEPTARGAYCGSLGYIGFDGTMDSSILIRTITSGRGWWQLPVGGGIVAASDPVAEYDETWHKAAGMLKALTP
jgi:para-aminobenzoate synthetase component I